MDKSCVEFRLKKFAIEAFRLEFRFGIEIQTYPLNKITVDCENKFDIVKRKI